MLAPKFFLYVPEECLDDMTRLRRRQGSLASLRVYYYNSRNQFITGGLARPEAKGGFLSAASAGGILCVLRQNARARTRRQSPSAPLWPEGSARARAPSRAAARANLEPAIDRSLLRRS